MAVASEKKRMGLGGSRKVEAKRILTKLFQKFREIVYICRNVKVNTFMLLTQVGIRLAPEHGRDHSKLGPGGRILPEVLI